MNEILIRKVMSFHRHDDRLRKVRVCNEYGEAETLRIMLQSMLKQRTITHGMIDKSVLKSDKACFKLDKIKKKL